MNLYKLTLIEKEYKGEQWDAMFGITVAAETPGEARQIANKSWTTEQHHELETGEPNYSENNNIWLYPKYTKLQKIGVAVKGIKKGSILEDVHWG